MLKTSQEYIYQPLRTELSNTLSSINKSEKIDLDDLNDDNEYPSALSIPGSDNKICVKYLSALIRLADEIDVTAARNSKIEYDLSKITKEIDLNLHFFSNLYYT